MAPNPTEEPAAPEEQEWKLVVRTPRKPETFFDLYSFGPHSYDPNPCLFQRRRSLGPLFFRLLKMGGFRKYSASKTKTRHAGADKSFLQRLPRYFHQRMPAGRLTGRCGKLRPFPGGFPWFLSILEDFDTLRREAAKTLLLQAAEDGSSKKSDKERI